MPYSKEHTALTRQRILDSAVRAFSRHGHDGVTLDDIMEGAELTRGAFYAHFTSKRHVYVEAMSHAAARGPIAALDETTDATQLKAMIRAYLDMAHVRQEGPICPLAFLVTDVAHGDADIRSVYTRVFEDMVDRVTESSAGGDRDTILALSAMMIGGVAVARALKYEAVSQQVLDACYATSERILAEVG